jgi:hypothetical protein
MVAAGMRLTLTFGDGSVPAIAEAGGKASSQAPKRPATQAPAPIAKPKRGGPKSGGSQGSLL